MNLLDIPLIKLSLPVCVLSSSVGSSSIDFSTGMITFHRLDFQTILPSLIVALTDTDKSVRQASAHCISALESVCGASSANGVYAFDTIYGSKSDGVQYLDWADMKKLVAQLSAEKSKFAEDAEAVRRWAAEALREKEGRERRKKPE